jgi:hypothetical protein
MRHFILLVGASLALITALSSAAPASKARWVSADEVRVRTGPSATHRISGTLPRGAQVELHSMADGFCDIDGEGQFGHVACQFLSETRIARPRAGMDGIDPAQRWVTGANVTLRQGPHPEAAVVQRLALNSVAKLLKEVPDSAYCEVRLANGAAGFTACRYLGQAPLNLALFRTEVDGAVSDPAYTPERAFWLQPSWHALMRYAVTLDPENSGKVNNGPWPRDEALEKMKAHLALGIKGARPLSYPDWAELKRSAAPDALKGAALGRLVSVLNLSGSFTTQDGNDPSMDYTIELARSLELPAVRPSLFRKDADLAPHSATVEQVSGRFDIVFRQLVGPRKASEDKIFRTSGKYDMLTRTQALVRPVQRVQLYRDGRFQSTPSIMSTKEILFGGLEETMCAGYRGGFAGGDSSMEYDNPEEAARGGVFAFYTTMAMPAGPAKRVETRIKLQRKQTGFIGGTHLHYDLDADGVADISVWEGQGYGPGYLDGPTETDDKWYRLGFVNINGAWKVLATDIYSYGCGC